MKTIIISFVLAILLASCTRSPGNGQTNHKVPEPEITICKG